VYLRGVLNLIIYLFLCFNSVFFFKKFILNSYVFGVLYHFDALILKIILKNKKIYYFDIFLSKKYFEK